MQKHSDESYFTTIRSAWSNVVYRAIALLSMTIAAVSIASHNARDCSQVDATNAARLQTYVCREWWIGFPATTVEDPIALFTLVLAISTIGLWFVTWQSSIDQHRMTRKALVATRRSANAARDQVSISRRALVDTERAYMFCDHIESNWTVKKETELVIKWTFAIVWRNSGRTPVKDGWSNANEWNGSFGAQFPADFDYPDYANPEPMITGPNSIMHAGGFEISIEELEEMRIGLRQMYIWGWCDYNDVFDYTNRHRSEFCFELIVTGNPIYKEGGFKYRRHGPFNGFDGECFRVPAPGLNGRSPSRQT
jgi:hypothetical protein